MRFERNRFHEVAGPDRHRGGIVAPQLDDALMAHAKGAAVNILQSIWAEGITGARRVQPATWHGEAVSVSHVFNISMRAP